MRMIHLLAKFKKYPDYIVGIFFWSSSAACCGAADDEDAALALVREGGEVGQNTPVRAERED
jgi:hypothetical protein